jgi:hypothetical protein
LLPPVVDPPPPLARAESPKECCELTSGSRSLRRPRLGEMSSAYELVLGRAGGGSPAAAAAATAAALAAAADPTPTPTPTAPPLPLSTKAMSAGAVPDALPPFKAAGLAPGGLLVKHPIARASRRASHRRRFAAKSTPLFCQCTTTCYFHAAPEGAPLAGAARKSSGNKSNLSKITSRV